MKYFYKISLLATLLLISTISFGTHLKGGEIRVENVSGQTYKISALIYFDSKSSVEMDQKEVKVCMGDGQIVTADLHSLTNLPNSVSTSVGIYEMMYTYSVAGKYQISTSVDNRNTGILNFSRSEFTPLFLWTVVNTEVQNSTPVLPFLQFEAGVKQVFSLDLKVTETNGDSVSFHLQKVSKTFPGTCGIRGRDQSYIYPNDVSKSGNFKLDQVAKKLLWNAPAQVGNYLLAFVVDEWRDGIIISQTYREGLISVIDMPGKTVETQPYEAAADNGIVITPPHFDSLEISIAVEAFPVPTDDFITVKVYSKNRSIITLQLIDLQGRILQKIVSRTAEIVVQEQFDLRDYAKGVYLIRAENDTESV